MLENMPLSGYAICYGPLVLVILGFIVFASITDAQARRTYLRRLDPRPENERPDETPIEVTHPMHVHTPTGMLVTIAPAEQPAVAQPTELPPNPPASPGPEQISPPIPAAQLSPADLPAEPVEMPLSDAERPSATGNMPAEADELSPSVGKQAGDVDDEMMNH